MAREYDGIEAEFAERMARGEPLEALLRELTMRLENQKAQDMAELHAYKQCHGCARLYTEAQWARLPPDNSKPWRNDSVRFEEYRFCEVCRAPLSIVERLRERVPGTARAVESISTSPMMCARCRLAIPMGTPYVIRLNIKTGRKERGEFCGLKCEGSK